MDQEGKGPSPHTYNMFITQVRHISHRNSVGASVFKALALQCEIEQRKPAFKIAERIEINLGTGQRTKVIN